MGIIDKLGIKPIERKYNNKLYPHCFDANEIFELEQKNNVMLEALIKSVLYHEYVRYAPNDIYYKNIEAIEKARYPKKWPEIKEMIS